MTLKDAILKVYAERAWARGEIDIAMEPILEIFREAQILMPHEVEITAREISLLGGEVRIAVGYHIDEGAYHVSEVAGTDHTKAIYNTPEGVAKFIATVMLNLWPDEIMEKISND